MKLEKINKEWITVDDFKDALGVGRKFAKLILENATIFSTMKKRYRYYDSDGNEVITSKRPCEHMPKYDIVYG
jgi:hypothetical protein